MFLENTVNQKEQFGWIEVICGSMFSGKTEELIRRLKRAKFARQRVEIFKPAVDQRYDEDKVISHDSNEIRSTTGANVNWLSPLGPVSFTFATNLAKADTDKTQSFNFSLGTQF